jgi:hypothetical protein
MQHDRKSPHLPKQVNEKGKEPDEDNKHDGVIDNSISIPTAPVATTPEDLISINSSPEGNVIRIVLERPITLKGKTIDHQKFTQAEYSKIKWSGFDDILIDIKLVIALECKIKISELLQHEIIPTGDGAKLPEIVIILPRKLSISEFESLRFGLINYLTLLENPQAKIQPLMGEKVESANTEVIREIAADLCKKRGGGSLPCEFTIKGNAISRDLKFTGKIGKVEAERVCEPAAEFPGELDGYRSSKHFLHFIWHSKIRTKGGLKIKRKYMKIHYKREEFEDKVKNRPHGAGCMAVLTVEKVTEGKKVWWNLKDIK